MFGTIFYGVGLISWIRILLDSVEAFYYNFHFEEASFPAVSRKTTEDF